VDGACRSTGPVSTSLSLIGWPSPERRRLGRKLIRAPDPSLYCGSIVLLVVLITLLQCLVTGFGPHSNLILTLLARVDESVTGSLNSRA
jgi:hypothetical protein